MAEKNVKTVLHSQTREFVIRLRDYFERESQNGGPLLPVTQVVNRTAEALGISAFTVSKITKEKYGAESLNQNVLSSPKKKRRNYVTDIDNFDTDAIRNHIYGYYTRKEYPTLNTLMKSLHEAGLYNGKRTSLHKIVRKIGFRYKKCNKRKIIMERWDIIMQRITFLREMNKIDNFDNVVFLDETWLNANHTVGRSWTDDTLKSSSKVPIGKGERLIICHAGNARGFINDCLLAFPSKKTSDYHEEMDGERFTKWFEHLLISLEEPSTIVMDNAPYHSMQVDKAPTSNNNKQEIVTWLQRNGVAAELTMLKVELLKLVKENKPQKSRYILDEMALKYGHQVIRLPPYHCHYNAIELIWAQIKSYVAKENTSSPFTAVKVMELLKKACEKVTPEDWAKVVEKTKNVIKKDFDRDIAIDRQSNEPFIISLYAESSDSSSESDSDKENEPSCSFWP